jgi:guanylate kinase
MDVQGCRQIKNIGFDACMIFLMPLNFEMLHSRLQSRGTENEAQIEQRLNTAKLELEYCHDTTLWDAVVVNNDLETCVTEIEALIFVKDAVRKFPNELLP